MICHGFKGGIGTASRVVDDGDYTVGVLVQANHGAARAVRRSSGVPVGPDPRAGTGAAPAASTRVRSGAVRSSLSSQRTRRCCRTSAAPRRCGRCSASRARAAPAKTRAATSRSRSRRDRREELECACRTSELDPLFYAVDRGDRGGDRQRAARRRDDDRPRRRHRPRARAGPSEGGNGPLDSGRACPARGAPAAALSH